MLNNPLRIEPNRDDGLLDIVIRMGGGTVQGIVTDANNKPLASRQVILVPDRARFQWQLHRIATTRADGQFSLEAVAPGSYRIFATDSTNYEWFGPGWLQRYESLGRPVRVSDSSSETVDLRILPSPGAK